MHGNMHSILPILITLLAAFIASAAQYVLKRHIERFGKGMRGMLSVLMKRGILMGLGLYALSLAVYLLALRSAPLSVAYPVFATTFVFVALFSRFRLGEKIGVQRALGIGLVFAGILIVAITY